MPQAQSPLDLRELDPPEPLRRILERIDSGSVQELVVRLRRDPLLLYPELAERGWAWEPVRAEAGEIQLRLMRLNEGGAKNQTR